MFNSEKRWLVLEGTIADATVLGDTPLSPSGTGTNAIPANIILVPYRAIYRSITSTLLTTEPTVQITQGGVILLAPTLLTTMLLGPNSVQIASLANTAHTFTSIWGVKATTVAPQAAVDPTGAISIQVHLLCWAMS